MPASGNRKTSGRVRTIFALAVAWVFHVTLTIVNIILNLACGDKSGCPRYFGQTPVELVTWFPSIWIARLFGAPPVELMHSSVPLVWLGLHSALAVGLVYGCWLLIKKMRKFARP